MERHFHDIQGSSVENVNDGLGSGGGGGKEGDLTQSYDKNPYTNRKFENQRTTQNRHQKLRLHNHCGPTKDGQLE